MALSLTEWSEQGRRQIESSLGECLGDAWPEAFARACAYPLATGGKRLRPLLTLAGAEALGRGVDPAVLGAGVAVELVHTYSLVHDDLPAMDDDDERRGKPTVHIAFGEASAILVGDALLTEAFHLLAKLPTSAEIRVALVAELAEAAGHRGMVGGQAADVGLGGPVLDLDGLKRVHRGKTGALIRAAVRMGGITAGADADQLAALGAYGEAIGLAFQLADDILDADQDADQGDGLDGPPSYVRLMGVERTRELAQQLSQQAEAAVAGLPSPAALIALARFAVARDH